MFVRDFVHLARPFGELAPRFLGDPQWIEPIMVGALRQVLAATDEVERAFGASRAVRCECGPAREQSDNVVVPLRSVVPGVLPTLDGDLRVSPFGSMRSHISLSAVWDTSGVDPVHTQHVFDEVTRTFLQHLVSQIDSSGDMAT